MKALVLSGGGAHGAYEAGVSKALLERESYDFICGVSIGAINAALIAAGTEGALEQFWQRELPARAPELFPHVPRLRRLLEHVGSIGQGGSWRDAMSVARAASEIPFLRNLGGVHRASLSSVRGALSTIVDYARLRMPLIVGATNVSTVSAAVFRARNGGVRPEPYPGDTMEYHDLDAGNFVDALLASSAMPGLFAPIELEFDGKTAHYADGCLVHTSPLGLAIRNGASEVTVLFVDPERGESSGSVAGVAQMAYNIATLWQQRMLDYEVQLAEATNEIVRRGGAPGKRQITIRYVRPTKPLELDMLAFDDTPALARVFAMGVADGAAAPLVRLSEAERARPATFWERLFPGTRQNSGKPAGKPLFWQ